MQDSIASCVPYTERAPGSFHSFNTILQQGICSIFTLWIKKLKLKENKQVSKGYPASLCPAWENCYLNQSCHLWGSSFMGSTGSPSIPEFFTAKANAWPTLSSHILVVRSLTKGTGYLWKGVYCLLPGTSWRRGGGGVPKCQFFWLLPAFSGTSPQWSVSPTSCCKEFCK